MTGQGGSEPTIMLLGGNGNAGLRIARLVLAQSNARVILAVVMAPALVLVKLCPGRTRSLVGRLFTWGLVRHTAPPYGAVLRLDAGGSDARRMTMTIWHEDAYALTASAAAACLLQYLDGAIPAGDLLCQGLAVDPGRFFGDLARLGAAVMVDGAMVRPKDVPLGALPEGPADAMAAPASSPVWSIGEVAR